MSPAVNESYWWHEALSALEASGALPELAMQGLRKRDPRILELTALALEVALLRHKVPGDEASSVTPLNVIARGAVVVLMVCEESRTPPSPRLTTLLRRLLHVDGYMRGSSHAVSSETDAILLMALIPDITAAEMADEIEIPRQTASRWLKDPSIREYVANLTQQRAEAVWSKGEADDIRARITDRRRNVRRGRKKKK